MNELLLTSGSRVLVPGMPDDTGPGPRGLIGYYAEDMGPGTQKGFFGEVASTDLINGDNLASMIGLTAGTAQNNTAPWLKFLIDGQIYFVAKQPYRHTVSRDHLNAAGAINGSKIIELGGYYFEVGLLEGLGPNPIPFAAGYDTPTTHGSEWNRLMYNVALPLATNDVRDSQVGPNWANYDQGGVTGGLWLSTGNGRRSWCKELNPTNAVQGVLRGHVSVSGLSHFGSTGANSTYGWRPRLKLVTA